MSMLSKSEQHAVTTYNLSSVGKALPSWLSAKRSNAKTEKKRTKADTKDGDRLELIQDLFFPTSCARVKVSPDGETLLATGSYPPQLRAYELRELSLKYSHHFTAEVVQFQATARPQIRCSARIEKALTRAARLARLHARCSGVRRNARAALSDQCRRALCDMGAGCLLPA
eukprot:6189647-Pleurochrysis_carterae.AAC.2